MFKNCVVAAHLHGISLPVSEHLVWYLFSIDSMCSTISIQDLNATSTIFGDL